MSPARVRAAVGGDGPSIARTQLTAWQETYGHLNPAITAEFDLAATAANWSQAAADPAMRVTVAETGAGIVGFAATRPSGDTGELDAIYLLAQAQGQGLGRLLADDAFAWLRQVGLTTCLLWVARDTAQARGFYEHLGFTADGNSGMWRGIPTLRYSTSIPGTSTRTDV